MSAQVASAFNRVALEKRFGYASIGRSHISMWVGGTKPTGEAPVISFQALSRRLKRMVTPGELGFAVFGIPAQDALEWRADPLVTLANWGEATWTRNGEVS